jgi:hypothetical protein
MGISRGSAGHQPPHILHVAARPLDELQINVKHDALRVSQATQLGPNPQCSASNGTAHHMICTCHKKHCPDRL